MIVRSEGLNEEQRQEIREMDVESRAKYVFRHLRKILDLNPNSHASAPIDRLISELFPIGGYRPPSDYTKLLEAIVLLERRGLVMRSLPEPERGGNRDRFIIYLTSVGKKSHTDDEVLLLVDPPEEIVRALEQKAGHLDEVVRQYYLESLRAYQADLHILSVFGLGGASERAIHWLAESIASSFPKYQGTPERKRNISDLIKYLSDSVIPNIFSNDKTFARELKELLDELGNLYRKNRNDAGHPKTVEQISWLGEGQAARLDLFRRYITTICEAIERLKNQPSS